MLLRTIPIKDNELSIIIMLADGMTNIQIARELDYSEQYITKKLSNLRRMFDARTTAQLIAKAYHHGVLIVPESQKVVNG